MQSLKKLKKIEGKRVLVRVDFNEPLKNGKLESDFRLKKTIPTINFLVQKKAKVILISHLGDKGETLAPVAKAFKKLINLKFVPFTTGEKVEKIVSQMKYGDVILLENIRKHPGEKNIHLKEAHELVRDLSKLADFYVNEAFSVSHRENTSIVLLPKFLPSYVGFQFEEEIKNLSQVFKKIKHPFLFILGGAKFSTKIPLIQKYLKLADNIFIGGALANDCLETDNFEVGQSLVDNSISISKNTLKNKKIILPIDVLVTKNVGKLTGSETSSKLVGSLTSSDYILDIGPESVKILESFIKKARLIVWNGPLGKSEGGLDSTKYIAKILLKQKNKKIILGGGDLDSFIPAHFLNNPNENPKIFISTGGGATLEYLSKHTLPGIQAVESGKSNLTK
jgi:phosphoglycerate kinase